MRIFDNFSDSADKGTAAGKQFLSKTYEHTTLKAFQLSALTVSMIAKLVVIGSFAFLGIVFLAISSAIALGAFFQNAALGYVSIGLLILLIALLIYFFRKLFDKKVITKMSKMFFS
jgi:magnesium-transporting ATPase (P-type)